MILFVDSTLLVFSVSSLETVAFVTEETPDVKFWAECRRRALELNIPAWRLAEEGFRHPALDKHTSKG